jgi:hypothetical protein
VRSQSDLFEYRFNSSPSGNKATKFEIQALTEFYEYGGTATYFHIETRPLEIC